MKRLFATFFLIITALQAAYSQNVEVKGKILDANDSTALIGATVLLLNNADSTLRYGAIADTKGEFVVKNVPIAGYRVRISFLGYTSIERRINLRRQPPVVGTIFLIPDATLLKDVTVKGVGNRVEMKGDTVQYNASAFKTNRDATTQDLIEKMPNITIENGQVKAQGEVVQRVTVDGREFFGDDATLALRNLPAEVVDKIQVFDRLSDQAQFTGFNDGQTTKTINIVTRGDRNNGQFGKIYAGAGTDGRYSAGGNTNYFKKNTRLSVIGISNNVNIQNFANEDLLGVLGGSNGGGGQGGNRQNFGGGGGRGGSGGMGGGGRGGNNADNFMVGQQGGISQTHALGFNYSDNWGKKWRVTGSYFFNDAQNTNDSQLARTFFSTNGTGQVYDENNYASSRNDNHRLNFRLEYTIDPRNSLIITPRLSFQNNTSYSSVQGLNTLGTRQLNQTDNNRQSNNNGYNFGNSVLWRHRFAKVGRTISISLNTSINDRDGESGQLSTSRFFGRRTADSLQIIDQKTFTASNNSTVSANLNYTENIGRNGQLQLSYSPSYTKNYSDRDTYNYNKSTSEYTLPDLRLSNEFDNIYLTNRAGVGYRFRRKATTIGGEVNYQNAVLSGVQLYPNSFEVRRTFDNFLPSLMVMNRGADGRSFQFFYRTNTNAPSIAQLQNVVNNNNPLFLSAGNPDLKQEYNHNFSTRYGRTNAQKGTSFFFNIAGAFIKNNISNTTYIATKDTTILGFLLKTGSQFSQPVNVNGNWNIRSFLTYGMPIKSLKSNLNFNIGTGYSRSIGLINNAQNIANTQSVNAGLVLSSNISERLDFTISTNANYNTVRNSLQPALDGTFYFQNTNLRFNWLTKKGFFVNSTVSNTFYKGLGQDFNLNFTLWNASIGQKFLKNQAGEIKLSTFDVLGQNNSVSRSITETYIEDLQTRVLQRFYMLTFTYTLRNFR